MGGDDHREGGLQARDPVERGEQRLPAGEIEPAAGLVEEQQARARQERPRDQRTLALSLRAVAEAPLPDRAEPERADELVRAVEVEAGEPLLEVSDRRRRTRADDLAHGQERGEAGADPRVDESDRLAQPREVGSAHPRAEDLDDSAGREVDGAGDREQGRLAGPVRPEQSPALARCDGPRDPVDDRLAASARRVPAPDAHVVEPEGSSLTGPAIAVYTH